ncbi:hypothetical protein L226DRAFT_161702 [Lentinus tigrinus ALCF2SS1-7]|uniref:Uncharacterized protein n=1 Tax=Lentinus tigrinus ALCF2SS1-6 TaxID=1328759 RepID=A0A5C2S1W9_9APHY|nr:hypothetical protein L227DRAFT_230393 [Lentinus tigrinus ALCF2SS1-6]RPD72080.1 hypothetical protein L226DRAFT_161702 [Lentinus tigrinus ALCF2SS1-7]
MRSYPIAKASYLRVYVASRMKIGPDSLASILYLARSLVPCREAHHDQSAEASALSVCSDDSCPQECVATGRASCTKIIYIPLAHLVGAVQPRMRVLAGPLYPSLRCICAFYQISAWAALQGHARLLDQRRASFSHSPNTVLVWERRAVSTLRASLSLADADVIHILSPLTASQLLPHRHLTLQITPGSPSILHCTGIHTAVFLFSLRARLRL